MTSFESNWLFDSQTSYKVVSLSPVPAKCYKSLPEQNTDVQYCHSNIINACKMQVLAEIILKRMQLESMLLQEQ